MAMKSCPSCGGSGVKNTSISKGASSNLCSGCGGSGQVVDHSAGSATSGGGGGGGATCFPAGTQVMTPRGNISIAEISAGDSVLAQSKDGQLLIRQVVKKQAYGMRPVSQMCFDDGTDLRATDHHTILTTSGWKRVGRIRPGDEIVRMSGESPKLVCQVCRCESMDSVFNIIVEGECTFIAQGFIAHSFTSLRVFRTLICKLRFFMSGINSWQSNGCERGNETVSPSLQ